MDKIKKQLLKDFKKANQKRKVDIALKFGFNEPSEYLAYLEKGVVVVKAAKPKVIGGPGSRYKRIIVKPTIHNVTILDASASMLGLKYENSKNGILKEFSVLKDDINSNFTFTLVEFIEEGNTKTYFEQVKEIPHFKFYGAVGNNTPLYSTVFDVINRVKASVPKTDKVLIKVYTDGQNNRAYNYTKLCANLIKEVEKENFTVTFVATEYDMKGIIKDLSLEKSNTLAVTNDGLGFDKAFKMSMVATQTYSSNVSRGLDVSKGFYKQTGKL